MVSARVLRLGKVTNARHSVLQMIRARAHTNAHIHTHARTHTHVVKHKRVSKRNTRPSQRPVGQPKCGKPKTRWDVEKSLRSRGEAT